MTTGRQMREPGQVLLFPRVHLSGTHFPSLQDQSGEHWLLLVQEVGTQTPSKQSQPGGQWPFWVHLAPWGTHCPP